VIDRIRAVGLAIGSLWLILVGGTFDVALLLMVATPAARLMSAAVAVIAVGLLAWSADAVARTLRISPQMSAVIPPRPQIRRYFIGTAVAEVVAIGGTTYLCLATGRMAWIGPLSILIVGLHFFPLAAAFRVPRYHVLGAAFCLASLGTIVAVPPAAHIGSALAWFAVPGMASAAWAVATGVAGLLELRRLAAHPYRFLAHIPTGATL
jgi:hypothetical protein